MMRTADDFVGLMLGDDPVGFGKPASMSSNRNQLSFGDAAPPSTNGSTSASRRTPRAPR
jgi:hypothetical protein